MHAYIHNCYLSKYKRKSKLLRYRSRHCTKSVTSQLPLRWRAVLQTKDLQMPTELALEYQLLWPGLCSGYWGKHNRGSQDYEELEGSCPNWKVQQPVLQFPVTLQDAGPLLPDFRISIKLEKIDKQTSLQIKNRNVDV